MCNKHGWPEPYIYTVYGRMYGDFPAKMTVYAPYTPIKCMVLVHPIYTRCNTVFLAGKPPNARPYKVNINGHI